MTAIGPLHQVVSQHEEPAKPLLACLILLSQSPSGRRGTLSVLLMASLEPRELSQVLGTVGFLLAAAVMAPRPV
jgi:hypothetical protein